MGFCVIVWILVCSQCVPQHVLSLAPHFVPYALPNVVTLGTQIATCEIIYILLMSRVNTCLIGEFPNLENLFLS